MKTTWRLLFCIASLTGVTGSTAGVLDRHEQALLILHLGLAHPLAGALLRAPVFDPSAAVQPSW